MGFMVRWKHLLLVLLGLNFLTEISLARTLLVGKTDGFFEVTNTGASSYSIPISVAPGTNKMQPNLQLIYNSQQDNGFVGVGWDVSGIPSIERCPATPFQDLIFGAISFTSQDRYCLAGQRMKVISGQDGKHGAEYRLELDSHAKFISYGDCNESESCSFVMWTKEGQKLEFGSVENSRIKSLGENKVRAWALNKASDSNSNYMTFRYRHDEGRLYPEEILYTFNASVASISTRTVQFYYENRSDLEHKFSAGECFASLGNGGTYFFSPSLLHAILC
jgi:hypothetical protein